MKTLLEINTFKAPFDISWLFNRDILRLTKILTSKGADVYVVGGSVRNSYWKEDIDNIDFSINVSPTEVKELLKSIKCKIIEVGIEHGTLSVLFNNKLFEITSFRKDIKTFGRKAIVKYTNNIKEDAKRRDFTFNTIYLNMKGEVIDPLDNFSDLKNGKVKFVGDAKKRIKEDHLRILRFFRFISKYPSQNSYINLKTLDTIKQSKNLIKKLSKERIWKEFKLILSSDGVCLALKYMEQTGVLNIFFSDISLKKIENFVKLENMLDLNFIKTNYFNTVEIKDPIMRLSILLQNKEKSLQEIFCLKKNENKMFNFYSKFEASPKSFKSIGFTHGLEKGLNLLLLYMAKKKNFDLYIKSKKFNEEFKRYCKDIIEGSKAIKKFPINGNDLIKIGYSGKKIGLILNKLKKDWIESGFKLNKKELFLQL
ncbi:MAG: CCA tRNA nucleotidyltransferase [Paracoccaceae bacterium]